MERTLYELSMSVLLRSTDRDWGCLPQKSANWDSLRPTAVEIDMNKQLSRRHFGTLCAVGLSLPVGGNFASVLARTLTETLQRQSHSARLFGEHDAQ